jgi:hypothetical protein
MKINIAIFITGTFLMMHLNSFASNYSTSLTEGATIHADTSFIQADTVCCGDTTLFTQHPLTIPNELAKFPGGDQALHQYFNSHIQYPLVAKNQGIEGRLYVQITLSASGNISHLQILNELGGGCEEEIMRVLTAMPRWEPQKIAGESVESSFIFSFNFQL